jgi:hypothetical protein
MSFSSGVSFRASLVPAAILSNVSLDDVGMMDDDDEDREEEESHESRSGFETVLAVSEEPSGTEKMELPIEDIVIPNTSSPVALTPHITEEQLVEAIREIRDGNTLSIGDSLKDWKEAIAMKLNLGAPLAKTWNPTIIQELAPKAKPSSPTRDDEVAKESDLESEHGGSSTALDVEADEKNPTINEELAVSDPGLSSLTFSSPSRRSYKPCSKRLSPRGRQLYWSSLSETRSRSKRNLSCYATRSCCASNSEPNPTSSTSAVRSTL